MIQIILKSIRNDIQISEYKSIKILWKHQLLL